MSIGNNLKNLRKKLNYTQNKVANYLNISQQAYAKYELELSEPDIKTLKTLCALYNVDMNSLVGNDIRGLTVYSEEQNQAINMLVQLNELNLSRASSYIAGLLVGQN